MIKDPLIGCAKGVRKPSKEWQEYVYIHDGLPRRITMIERWLNGYNESELLPCFKCGEKPQIIWMKFDGKIMFRISHKCKPGYTLPPGGSYATSNIITSFEISDSLLRLLWNETQRQLKITAERSAQLGKI